jgi:hypothetical protein
MEGAAPPGRGLESLVASPLGRSAGHASGLPGAAESQFARFFTAHMRHESQSPEHV